MKPISTEDYSELPKAKSREISLACDTIGLTRILSYLSIVPYAQSKVEIKIEGLCRRVYSGLKFLIRHKLVLEIKKAGHTYYCLPKNLQIAKEMLKIRNSNQTIEEDFKDYHYDKINVINRKDI